MNLKNLTPVGGQPGLFKIGNTDATVRLEAPDGTPYVPSNDKKTPPATPAPATPAAPPPAAAAPAEPAKPEPDAFTAARQRLEPNPIVPTEKPTTEQVAAMDPYAAARTRLAHNLYGEAK